MFNGGVNLIIDIDGPSAVGKTTILRTFENLNDVVVEEEILKSKKSPIIKILNREDFLNNQLWFLNESIRRYNVSNKFGETLKINDLGIIDILLHTKYYPASINKNWDILEELCGYIIEKNIDFNIDFIFYLTAKNETLINRKNQDKLNSRTHHEENMRLLNQKESFYKKLEYYYPESVFFINSDKANPNNINQNIRLLIEKYKFKEVKLSIQMILKVLLNE